KYLHRRGCTFQLEAKIKQKRRDLLINGRYFEFKFHFDWDMEKLAKELGDYSDRTLEEMWVDSGNKRGIDRTWAVAPQIYKDVCVTQPRTDVFVWIIYSRDLTKVSKGDLERVCCSKEQMKWCKGPQPPDGFIAVADEMLNRLKSEAGRPFRVLREEIAILDDQ